MWSGSKGVTVGGSKGVTLWGGSKEVTLWGGSKGVTLWGGSEWGNSVGCLQRGNSVGWLHRGNSVGCLQRGNSVGCLQRGYYLSLTAELSSLKYAFGLYLQQIFLNHPNERWLKKTLFDSIRAKTGGPYLWSRGQTLSGCRNELTNFICYSVPASIYHTEKSVSPFLCRSEWNFDSSFFNCPQVGGHPRPESLFSAACLLHLSNLLF